MSEKWEKSVKEYKENVSGECEGRVRGLIGRVRGVVGRVGSVREE